MQQHRYKAVIFDFFGVISTEVAPRWLEKRVPKEKVVEMHASLTAAADRGEETAEHLYERVGRLFDLPADDIHRQWNDLVQVDPAVVDIIKSLRPAYKTALCTNAFSEFISPILQENELPPLFDIIAMSGELHIAKPDPRIYEYTLDRLAITPQEAIFVDDNEHNVTAASDLGITALLFTSAKDLSYSLKNLLDTPST